MTAPGDRPRCGWATSAPEYVAYHDEEWGTALHGDVALFERLSLEAFQSGLSWIVILRKRPAFRAAFAGFDPSTVAGFDESDVERLAFRAAFAGFDLETVAGFDESDVERLLADPGIVRNRAKITATIANARAALEVGDLDALLWSYAPDAAGRRRPQTLADVPATSPESTALAKDLKKRGFRFVGPTTAYALMQATGMVDDHVATCWRSTP